MGAVQIVLDNLELGKTPIIGWYKLFNESACTVQVRGPGVTTGPSAGSLSGSLSGGGGGASLMSASMDSFSWERTYETRKFSVSASQNMNMLLECNQHCTTTTDLTCCCFFSWFHFILIVSFYLPGVLPLTFPSLRFSLLLYFLPSLRFPPFPLTPATSIPFHHMRI